MINKEKCRGCELCLGACPFGAITVTNKKAAINDNCTLCGACVESCNFGAIEFLKDAVEKADLSAYRGVWVFAEQYGGEIKNVVFELLGQAQKLAGTLGTGVSAVLFGEGMEEAAAKLAAYGADQVYLVDHPGLKQYNDEVYAGIFAELIKRYRPEIILIGATAYGRSLAPRVASRLDTGLTADCTGLEIDPETRMLLQTRPAFGGNLMATIVCPRHRPQMATVRPRVMKALEPDPTRKAKIIKPQISVPTPLRVKTLGVIKAAASTASLAEAGVIVAAGKGMGDPKNLQLVEELARLLGAGIGATRAIVDAGWIGYSHQVGQTGKTVAPKVYIACGISGAIQHLAGMSSADVIIAINNDPEANIFKIAHYGIVGNCLEVIPALIKELTSPVIIK
jgi:electron transfer flavoprotein alpha subunit